MNKCISSKGAGGDVFVIPAQAGIQIRGRHLSNSKLDDLSGSIRNLYHGPWYKLSPS